uniref:ATP citrate synthase n=1 Tax=Globodera pallida TaxID=36090 RepID=A0A183C8G5_GLOPA
MSAKAVNEYSGKELLYRSLNHVQALVKPKAVQLDEHSNFDEAILNCEWINKDGQGVLKPDQLIKRRGKHGLVKIGSTDELAKWFNDKKGNNVQIGKTTGRLSKFILEPLCKHDAKDELYVAIYSKMNEDLILFYEEGGVEARHLIVPVQLKDEEMELSNQSIDQLIGNNVEDLVKQFVRELYDVYKKNHFTYLEINPLVVRDGRIYILDLAAKLDETAAFLCSENWKTRLGHEVEFPAPFGRDLTSEEKYIADLDAKTGASLKLTVLNRKGRVWTMVAGGGASVVFTDTVCDLGGASELANYGEYSGDPNETQTFEYAKTILTIMTEGEPHPKGKVLIIGGSIANFTNVSATFKGIIRAIEMFAEKLRQHKVTIYVRRGGPNYQGGLRKFKEASTKLNLPIHVFGPETHMTSIVGAALGVRPLPEASLTPHTTGQFLLAPERGSSGGATDGGEASTQATNGYSPKNNEKKAKSEAGEKASNAAVKSLFERDTKAIIWGQQQRAIQGMLDFDYVCKRDAPSVVASTYPFTGDHKQKYYFGQKEMLIPAYKSMETAFKSHPEASVMVTFASMRSVFQTVLEALDYPQIKVIAIIAEGVPENQTRKLIKVARQKGVTIIGPATVGGIKPGCFKIGNTGGMMDNILASKLYRAGSVAYVSRSGGMSNELNNIISHNTDGVFEGIAIGGRPKALKEKRISKPLIAWCIGTCADHITSEVQFGHAGASANAARETAANKNAALKAVGAHVPDSFDDFGVVISKVYKQLVENGSIVPRSEEPPPPVPMDYAWAKELGLIRKPASFMTSICDERGEELLYAGVPITRVLEDNVGVGGVLGLLWFQKRLPEYANRFFEICLMLTADHGPAVSGAHNTIVCARAGKDLISSLVSGLLTIGDRFGGALDGAAKSFSEALDAGLSPMQFVNEQKRLGKLIPGIGHRVKSINNPDKRVEILKEIAKNKAFFKQETPLFDYALKVEQITTSKKREKLLRLAH